MDVVSTIIKIILCLFSLFLIIVVLLQSGNKTGLSGAVGGGAEMLVGKSKARGMDSILAKMTRVAAVGFMILAVALVVLSRFAS